MIKLTLLMVCCMAIGGGASSNCCTCLERTCQECNADEQLVLDLSGGSHQGSLTNVTIQSGPTAQSTQNNCSYQYVLKARFESAKANDCRNLLRIDMTFATSRGGWMFNFGDSQSNNGYGGDSSHQQNDCEMQGLHGHVRVYASDICGAPPAILNTYASAVGTGVTSASVWIGNNFYKITNSNSLDDELCHECLYALDGQADSQGPVNQDVYLSFNRVIASTSRSGWGVCRAVITWACPDYCEVIN